MIEVENKLKVISRKETRRMLNRLTEIAEERQPLEELYAELRSDFYCWLRWAKRHRWFPKQALDMRLERKYYRTGKEFIREGAVVTELQSAGTKYYGEVKKYEKALNNLKLQEERILRKLYENKVPRPLIATAMKTSRAALHNKYKRYSWFKVGHVPLRVKRWEKETRKG